MAKRKNDGLERKKLDDAVEPWVAPVDPTELDELMRSGASDADLDELMRGPSDDELAALMRGPSDDDLAALMRGPSDDELAALMRGPSDDDLAELMRINAGSVAELDELMRSGASDDDLAELMRANNPEVERVMASLVAEAAELGDSEDYVFNEKEKALLAQAPNAAMRKEMADAFAAMHKRNRKA